jgi:hypothetical protein
MIGRRFREAEQSPVAQSPLYLTHWRPTLEPDFCTGNPQLFQWPDFGHIS